MSDCVFYHPINLPDFSIRNNVWLAPMAGFTNSVFRKMVLNFGAGLTFTEMVSIEGLIRNNIQSFKKIEVGCNYEVIQLFGSDEKKFVSAVRYLSEKVNLKMVDINFGCPVKKVLKGKAGAFLLKHPQKMADIVKALKDENLLVSAKIRAGFDKEELENIIPLLDNAGADIISLHARLATQFYSGNANWEYVARARQMTKKFLIANGDIKKPEDVKNILKITGADGVMIGRAALEKPYIFKMVKEYFESGNYHEPSKMEVKKMILNFAKNYCEHMKSQNIVAIRGILLYMTKGLPFSRELRDKIAKLKDYSEMETIFVKMCSRKTLNE